MFITSCSMIVALVKLFWFSKREEALESGRGSCKGSVCISENKGPRLTLPRADGNISFVPSSLCSFFQVSVYCVCPCVIFFFLCLHIAKRYQETVSSQVFWENGTQQVCMASPSDKILNLKLNLYYVGSRVKNALPLTLKQWISYRLYFTLRNM